MMKKTMKDVMKKMVKKVQYVFLLCSLWVMNTSVASAKTIEESVLVTGTKKLLTDVSKTIMVIAPIAGGVFMAFQFFMLQNADDDGDVKAHKKKIKMAAIGTVGVFVAATLINIIAGYYGYKEK